MKISVITVVYNAARDLTKTIKSVLSQNNCNLEYIIIDGESTDGTVDIIKKYQPKLTYWISEKDTGIYDAMNKGIDQANGDWIVFMNAGDCFCDENTINRVSSSLDSTVDIVSGDIYLCHEDTKEYTKARGVEKAMEGMFCFHQTMFTRAELCKKYKFDTGFKIAADYDFTLKCLMNGARFKYLPYAIADFAAGGLSEKLILKARIEDMFIQSKYLQPLEDVFGLPSYTTLKRFEGNNNYLFAGLFNDLMKQLEIHFNQNNKIVLYGYGHIGKLIHQIYKDNIIAVVDMSDAIRNEFPFVLIPNEIKEIDFDAVLISVLGREKEISCYLNEILDIDTNKIIIVNI